VRYRHESAEVLAKLAAFTFSGLSLHHVTSRKSGVFNGAKLANAPFRYEVPHENFVTVPTDYKYVKSATKDLVLIVNTKNIPPQNV
jgi:hypothetical protein